MPEYPPRPDGMSSEQWAKRRAEADVADFITSVGEATIEEVDTPTGRKQVEIAWEDDDGFHVASGEVYGLYRDGESLTADWVNAEDEPTVVEKDNVVSLEESEYYTTDRLK